MNPSSFPSKPTIGVEKAITNQKNVALIVSKHLLSTKAKHSNFVFSPASINSALTLAASGPEDPSVSDEILSFLRSSSTNELNAVFSKIVSVVFADHSANGGPKISFVNGVWIEQTLPIDHSSFKDLFENVFKAVFDRVDFRSKAEQVRRELNKWAEDRNNGRSSSSSIHLESNQLCLWERLVLQRSMAISIQQVLHDGQRVSPSQWSLSVRAIHEQQYLEAT